MAPPQLTPKAIFGQRSDVKKNAHFVNDEEIVYPCESSLIFQDFTNNKQKYLMLQNKTVHLELLLVSPNRNLIATLVNAPEGAQIFIFDVDSLKKKRTITLPPDAQTKRIEWMDFSFDERFVMVVTGDPDWMMLAFNWERGKIETFTKANYITNPSAPVREVVCSPADSSIIAIFGQGIFRLMNMQETIWRQYGFQKAENLDIVSCCFLTGDRVLCGTSNGLLIMIELGELKFVFEADVVTQINARAEKEEEFAGVVTSSMLLERASEQNSVKNKAVRALTPLSKGFAFAIGTSVHFFEKLTPHKYKKRNIYEITEKDFREDQTVSVLDIKHLAANVSQDKLIATTGIPQFYEVKLWGPEMDIAGKVPFKHLGPSFHNGYIADLALCYWKPIFVTCGKIDRTVRVWNYLTESLEMMKQYQEDVHSVSLHPTGLYAAIGFSDKLRLVMLLIDDLLVSKEFPIRECPRSEFNVSGSLLAAVNRNVIQIYSLVSCQNMAILKGFSATVNCLRWTTDDKKLVACGSDGAIYEWDTNNFKRIGEIVNKGINYLDCALATNDNIAYTVGSDNYLKEIRNSNVVRKYSFPLGNMNHVTISKSDAMMFVSGDNGSIVSINTPIEDPPDSQIFAFHSCSVAEMKLTLDDRILISCSASGSVCIWNITNSEGKVLGYDKNYIYFSEILISKNDLEEKLSSIKDLTQRNYELEMEHAYQMRHIDTVYKDKMKIIQETYQEAIEELKGTLEYLEANHMIELNNISSDLNVIKEKHEAEMLEIEAKYNADLIVEYNKVSNLEKLKEIMIEDYETKLAALQKSKEKTIAELTRMNESKLYNLNKMMEEAKEEITKEVIEHEELTHQIEDDNDREIQTLKTKYEKILKHAKETNIRLKGESGVLNKKILSSKKEIDVIQMEIINLMADHEKFKLNIIGLEQEILDLKKEISERDLRIQDKEKRIYDLKRKDQEYERYKFVLNYRIKELKNQIEPRDKEIKEKKEQIAEMELELDELQKVNLILDNHLSSMREKLNSVYKLLHVYKKKCSKTVRVIQKVKTDIFIASGNIQDYKVLKDRVKKLYFKYVTDKDFDKTRISDEECVAELRRQKNYLEGIVKSLETDIENLKYMHYGDGMIYMEMNWNLMEEIYKIRKKLKIGESKILDMEAIIGVRMTKTFSPRQVYKIVQNALKPEEDVKEECQIKTENAMNKVAMMKDELEILTERINYIEMALAMNEPTHSKKRIKTPLKFNIPSII